MRYRLLVVLLLALSLTSCRSKKKILYFQNPSEIKQEAQDYELKIQTDDLLYIQVMSTDMDAVKPFNSFGLLYNDPEVTGGIGNSGNSGSSGNSGGGGSSSGGGSGSGSGSGGVSSQSLRGYLVDSNGFIDFPEIGKLKVANLTKSSLVKLLEEKLSVYLKNPVVKIRFLNFKVTVLGESGTGAKTVTFDTEKVSLPQLLSHVGDMTMLSERYKVVIVRDVDGIKTVGRIDPTQASVVNSPYYYLAQNDVIYIEPTRNAIDSGAIPSSLKNASIILGAIASILLIINNIK